MCLQVVTSNLNIINELVSYAITFIIIIMPNLSF